MNFSLRLVACAVVALGTASLYAQPGTPAAMRTSGKRGDPTVEGKLPGPLQKAQIQQKLDAQLPLDLVLADERGERRPLGQYLSGKPVIFAMVYYECRMLCDMTMNGLLRAVRPVSNLSIGTDFDVIFVSFDAKETPQSAAKKRAEITGAYDRPGAGRGWHFLTGDQATVGKIAETAGFSFAWDEKTNQWAHSAALMVLTPQGRISKYFYGVEYSSRDLRLGLVDASAGKIGTLADQVMLFCFHYDPIQGKYGMTVMTILRVVSAALVLAIGLYILLNVRGDRRRKNNHGQGIPAYTR
jgi:protein SCO1